MVVGEFKILTDAYFQPSPESQWQKITGYREMEKFADKYAPNLLEIDEAYAFYLLKSDDEGYAELWGALIGIPEPRQYAELLTKF